jgi:very-short-patch-repair endonuclease
MKTSPPNPPLHEWRGEYGSNCEHDGVVGGAVVKRDERELARELRHAGTNAEGRAWEILRDRRLLGLKFRRQQPIGRFVVDFYCATLRVALELDGSVHDGPDAKARDEERDREIEARGIRVVRVRNEDVSAEALLRLLTPLSIHGEGRGVRSKSERGGG